MDFERARTKEQFKERQIDIINACRELYDEEGYEGINFKKLSETTAIKRSTIYNYYTTKEEILIDVLANEMDVWMDELNVRIENVSKKTSHEFAIELTDSLICHPRLLKLYSILFTLLETNCRLEKLVEFKIIAIKCSETLCAYIAANNPHMTEDKVLLAANQIMSYVLGLYPMSHFTDKQLKALEIIGSTYHSPEFTSLCIAGIEEFIKE